MVEFAEWVNFFYGRVCCINEFDVCVYALTLQGESNLC